MDTVAVAWMLFSEQLKAYFRLRTMLPLIVEKISINLFLVKCYQSYYDGHTNGKTHKYTSSCFLKWKRL